MHEALNPISWLAGRWFTENGEGKYPNINDFKYKEELEFICIGQPMFNFKSISTHPEEGVPMHQERGFLRINPNTNSLAFMVSHNFGVTSMEEGEVNPETKEIKLESVNVARMSFSKLPHVTKIKRCFRLLSEDTLELIIHMETDNTPMTQHLKAVYKKETMDGN